MNEHCNPGEQKRKKSGQTKCNNCHKIYNNKSVPKMCSNTSCNSSLDGNFAQKPSKTGAFLLDPILASVRLNEKGTNVRTFASVGEDKKVITLPIPYILNIVKLPTEF